MGFVDNRLILSSNQNVGASTAILGSTNVIDLQSLRDLGRGEPLYVRFTVTTSFSTLADVEGAPMLYTGITTSEVDRVAGVTSLWYTDSSVETHLVTGGQYLATGVSPIAFPIGKLASYLTAGRTWYMPIPPFALNSGGSALGHRYLGASYWQLGYVGGTLSNCVFTGSGSAEITKVAHGLSDGYRILFATVPAGGELATATYYYVVNAATDTFEVSATEGGTAITVAASSGLTHSMFYYGRAFASGNITADIVDSTHLPKLHYPIGYSE